MDPNGSEQSNLCTITNQNKLIALLIFWNLADKEPGNRCKRGRNLRTDKTRSYDFDFASSPINIRQLEVPSKPQIEQNWNRTNISRGHWPMINAHHSAYYHINTKQKREEKHTQCWFNSQMGRKKNSMRNQIEPITSIILCSGNFAGGFKLTCVRAKRWRREGELVSERQQYSTDTESGPGP